MKEISISHRHFAVIGLGDGTSVQAERIGQGRYCTAYRHRNDVYLFVSPDDHSKEIITNLSRTGRPRRKHLPRCEWLGSCGDDRVYRMPYYPKPTPNYPWAWGAFRALETAREKAWNRYAHRRMLLFCGYEINSLTIDLVRSSLNVGLLRALEDLRDEAACFGSSMIFEFAKRNLGLQLPGNRLILRDCVFDMEKLHRERISALSKRAMNL